MHKEKRREIGKRIKDILKSHQSSQADLARALAKQEKISFKAAQVKVSRIIKGQFEADYDFWNCLYNMFEPNIGYLIAEKGEPYVKPFK
jgi:transcriptional regulator with XRE-family HTH domain